MSRIDQKEAVRRFMTALESNGNIDLLDDICTPSVAKEWRATMERFAFDDRTFTLDAVIEEGATVGVLWSLAATHNREFAGLAPTGKRTSNSGSTFFTFEDDKIARVASHYDADSLYSQLGATVTLGD